MYAALLLEEGLSFPTTQVLLRAQKKRARLSGHLEIIRLPLLKTINEATIELTN